MYIKKIATALLSAVMLFSLAACSNETPGTSDGTNTPSGDNTAEEVHLNLTESWGFKYYYTISSPEISNDYGLTYYLTSFYDTLFETDQNGDIVGLLVDDWSMSEDGTVYTFQIKQGIKFSDGSDLTAEDVAQSLLAVPVNLGAYNGSYGRLSTIIENVVVTDDYTVEMHLTQPYYNALRELCLANPFGIVSSEQLNEDLTAKDSFLSATYGSGPYMYTGDNDGQTWNFVRNPYYWGEAPDVDSFSITMITDNDAKLLALKNGEIDFVYGISNVSSEAYDEIANTDGFTAQRDDNSFRSGYIGYNLTNSIFSEQVVREALAMCIDKVAINNDIYGGLNEVADTFFPTRLPHCDVEQKTYEFNIDEANRLLDEAGYIDTDGDGIREMNGEKMSTTFMYQTGSSSDDNMVVYVCDQASKIGIELTPQSAQMMDWYALILEGDYGATVFRTQGGYYDPANVVSNMDPSMAMDPIISQVAAFLPGGADLITELDSATDEARIQEIYDTILTTMADNCLTLPLMYTHQIAIYNNKIADYEFSQDGNFTAVENIKLNK